MSGRLRYQRDNLEEIVENRTSELMNSNEKLQKTLDENKKLKGILPICMHCKEIRDKGYWNKLESYIRESLITDLFAKHIVITKIKL